ncbi:MAG TPA: nucleotidyltransferase family protein [Candidatus Polarisedimenticolia bacterium]
MTDPVISLLRGEGPLPGPREGAWDAVARQAVSEGLAGIALSLLSRSGRLQDLTPSARGILEADLTKVRLEQTLLFHRFEALRGTLDSAQVDFIVHKGGALAPLLYPRLEDRPMVDIDIVIRPEAWRRVRDALVAARYRLPPGSQEAFWLENYFNLSVTSPEDPASHFDVHWSLTQEGRYHVATEDLFARAVPYQLGGSSLKRLADEDLLLSLFLHLAYHYFEASLIWLYDMKLVIERLAIDWDTFFDRAARWGLMAVVAFNMVYLEKVFPGSVPVEVLARGRPGAFRSRLAGPFMSSSPRHLFRGEERRLNQLVLGLLSIDRPADAARFAAGKIGRTLRWAGRRPRLR